MKTLLLVVYLLMAQLIFAAAPVITSSPVTTATQGSAYLYTLLGNDADGDSLTWSGTNGTTLPTWLSLTSSTGIIHTIAGTLATSGATGDGGAATSATFYSPTGVAVDSSGNIYIADSNNYAIRKVDVATGIISTFAGTLGTRGSTGENVLATTATFKNPTGIAVDSSDNVYIADSANHAIREVNATTGIITTVAGKLNSSYGASGDGGLATSARLDSPEAIAFDSSGNLYIADKSHYAIRKVDATTGIITTVAGTFGTSGATGDGGAATSATLNYPDGVAVDSNGNIYISEYGNHTIRKVDATTGNISTIVGTLGTPGSSGDGGLAINATLNYPERIALDSSGNLYIADTNNHAIRKVDATTGIITTVVGTFGIRRIPGDAATSENLDAPYGVTLDSSGNIYIGDTTNQAVRKVDATTNLTGTPTNADVGVHDVNLTVSDGNGGTTTQNFQITVANVNDVPTGITLSNSSITENNTTGVTIGTFTTADVDLNISVGETSTYSFCSGTDDANFTISGDALQSNAVFNYEAKSSYSVCIRTTDSGSATFDKNITISILNVNEAPTVTSTAITTATQGSAYLYTLLGNDVERDALTWSGTNLPSWLSLSKFLVSTLAGQIDNSFGSTDGNGTVASFYSPSGVAVDASGNIYIADSDNNKIRKISSSGVVTTLAGSGTGAYADGTGSAASFKTPRGVAVDASGNVYVTDTYNNRIRKISSNGVVTTLAGSGASASQDGTGTAASLYRPVGIAIDTQGTLYVTEFQSNKIRKITSSGVVTTLAGSGTGAYADGTGTAASFNRPYGIAVDNNGTLYVADLNNNRIRKITSSGVVTTLAGSGAQGSADGTGTAASFNGPYGVAVDTNGNVYVVDSSSNKIRKITSSGVVTTLAGSGVQGSADGTGTAASFNIARGIAVDSNGTLYVADTGNNKIRNIVPSKLTGTPTNADVGVHDVNLTVSDGNGGTATQNFQITVANVNDAPTSNNASFTMNEDINKTFAVNDFNFTDIDVGSSFNSIFITTLPTAGTLTLSDVNVTLNQEINSSDISNLVFAPVANANGTPYTTFGFKVNDGDVNSTLAYTATINVNAVDDAPTLDALSNVTTLEDGTDFNITLTSNDIEGNPITYTVSSSNTSIATVAIVNGHLIVTQVANGNGIATIEVNATANDLIATRDFNINVTAVNDAPNIDTNFSAVTINEDAPSFKVDVNVSDVDGNDLNLTVASNNTALIQVTQNYTNLLNQGAYNGVTLDFNLTSQANANGVAQITLSLNDGTVTTTKTFDVNVTAVNDAPVLSQMSNVIVYQNAGDKNITLSTLDVDNDHYTYSKVIADTNIVSTVSFNGDTMTITPVAGVTGATDINVTVTDVNNASDSKVFNFYILPLEDGADVEKVNEIITREDENGTSTTLDINNNLSVATSTDANGTVTHIISVGDINTTSHSDLNGSVVAFTSTGVHTTYSDANVSIEVNATLTGQAVHELTVGGVLTKATSEYVGASTKISKDANGSIEITTSVSPDANTLVSVTARADGTAQHRVTKNGKTTVATSELQGASTVIDSNAKVITTQNDSSNDETVGGTTWAFKAIVATDANGKTITTFERRNSTTGAVKDVQDTFKPTTPYDIGSKVVIGKIGGVLYFQTNTNLSSNLEVE